MRAESRAERDRHLSAMDRPLEGTRKVAMADESQSPALGVANA
jgi:hypothetical protein